MVRALPPQCRSARRLFCRRAGLERGILLWKDDGCVSWAPLCRQCSARAPSRSRRAACSSCDCGWRTSRNPARHAPPRCLPRASPLSSMPYFPRATPQATGHAPGSLFSTRRRRCCSLRFTACSYWRGAWRPTARRPTVRRPTARRHFIDGLRRAARWRAYVVPRNGVPTARHARALEGRRGTPFAAARPRRAKSYYAFRQTDFVYARRTLPAVIAGNVLVLLVQVRCGTGRLPGARLTRGRKRRKAAS